MDDEPEDELMLAEVASSTKSNQQQMSNSNSKLWVRGWSMIDERWAPCQRRSALFFTHRPGPSCWRSMAMLFETRSETFFTAIIFYSQTFSLIHGKHFIIKVTRRKSGPIAHFSAVQCLCIFRTTECGVRITSKHDPFGNRFLGWWSKLEDYGSIGLSSTVCMHN